MRSRAKASTTDKELPPRAALSAYIFLAGVVAIILLGLFESCARSTRLLLMSSSSWT